MLLNQLTSEFLRSVEAETFLPELLPLKNVIENNIGHDHQPVFDHIVAVMAGLEKVLKGDFLTAEAKICLGDYLNQFVGSKTKRDLLRLVVLVHDLSKEMAFVITQSGKTICPGHEFFSTVLVPNFKTRFDLNEVEIEYVQQIVRLHGSPSEILNLGLAKPENQSQFISQYNLGTQGLGIELMLFIYADILGGDWIKLNRSDFEARTGLCQTWLQKLVQDLA
jgi:hypothetical protein